MKKVLVIDNYDSFTYNLVHAIEQILESPIAVSKNDKISLQEIDAYSHIVLSPGPGLPKDAGITKDVIKNFSNQKCILGVCLGLQSIAEVFQAQLKNLKTVYHGIQSEIYLTDHKSPLYKNIETRFHAGRYHSWAIDETTIQSNLIITAKDQVGEVMSIDHASHKTYGVQFHPESILTDVGNQIITNFLSIEI